MLFAFFFFNQKLFFIIGKKHCFSLNFFRLITIIFDSIHQFYYIQNKLEVEMDLKNPSNPETSQSKLLQLVSFHIGDEEFAIDILNIQGINRMMEITRVPNSPYYVEGIINLRGQVIPVVNLRKRLGFEPKEPTKETRIIVVEIANRVIGFIVDSVNEVLRISSAITEPPPPMVAGIDSEYITAVGKLDDRLLILLDLEKVLSGEDYKTLENIQNQ